MTQLLLFLAFPALLFGIVVLVVWFTVREKRQLEEAIKAANVEEPPVVPSNWFLASERGEFGPFGLEQLHRFKEQGLIEEATVLKAADGGQVMAASVPGLFAPVAPPPEMVPVPVDFQTFSGHRDPVRLGRGELALRDGALVLRGRRRRVFAWRKEDEAIPLARIRDVAVEGRLLRFVEDGTSHRLPRLVRLASPELAREVAAMLPDRQSEEAATLRADNAEFARFMAGGKPTVTVAIILVNLAIYLWMGGRSNAWMRFSPAMLTDLGGNLGPFTTTGEWWRLLTAVFLHGGFMHVAMNMFALWEAGRVTERLFGPARYLGAYLVTGLLASIASINWQQQVVSIGASGAVFGIYGVLMAALALDRQLLPVSVTRRLRNGALVFVGYALLQSLGQKGIDHAAHVGGLFAGMLIGGMLVLPRMRASMAAAATIGLGVAGVIGAVAANAPYADEREFRRFMAQFGQEENRLNAVAKELMPQADRIGAVNLARRIDAELIPGWQAVSAKFAELERLLPLSKELRQPLYEYARLKHESLVMFRDAFRSEDEDLARLAGERLQEANRHVEIAKQTMANRMAANAGKPGTAQTPAAGAPAPALPSVGESPVARMLKGGDWASASREMFREAGMAYGKGADLVAERLLAGHVEEALGALPGLPPGGRNYVYFRAVKDGKGFDDARKLAFARESAATVRGQAIPANIASDALVRAALGVSRYGPRTEAVALMEEALAVARAGKSEEQGAALRALPEVLNGEPWADPLPLVAIAESAARIPGDPFNQAFAMAAMAQLWHRLGDPGRARAWWQEGLQVVKTIPERNRHATAEARFARVAAEFGDRSLADEMIAARRGNFVDVLAKDVMVIAAKRGDVERMVADFAAMKGNCGASISTAGFAGRDAVDALAGKGEFMAARQLLAQMAPCAPRFVAESWLLLGWEARKRDQKEVAQESLRNASGAVRAVTNRAWDAFELQVMIRAAELAVQLGQRDEAVTMLDDIGRRVDQLPPHRVDDKVTVLAKAGRVARLAGRTDRAADYFTRCYQLAMYFPKDAAFADMGKARAMSMTARELVAD